jgi:ATP-dependent Clp protease adapter protein ClpS
VRIINNDVNTYEQVITITMRALGLTFEQAYSVAWAVDHEGSCVVCIAEEQQARGIAAQIRTIGIEVEVEKWLGA